MAIFAIRESVESALLVYAYLFLIALVYLTISTFVGLLLPRVWVLLLSLFVAVSLLELKLIYYNVISGLANVYLTTGFFAVVLIILLTIVRKNFPSNPNLALYVGSAVIFIMAPLLTINDNLFGKEAKLTTDESEFLEQLSLVTFDHKPNVYLLGFDAMIPAYTAKKYLGINQLPYNKEIDRSFIEFVHSASVGVPTSPSLNGLMSLDQSSSYKSKNYFNGAKPSVLGTLFKQNGYEVTTGYASYYFGEKGPYVDNYVIGSLRALNETVQCFDKGENFYQGFRAFGACEIIGRYESLEQVISMTFHRGPLMREQWPEQVLREVREGTESDAPQLKIFYSYKPNGHVDQNYRHSNISAQEKFRKYFLAEAVQLNKILEELAGNITSNDPTALLVVFGDHGAWLSRGVTAGDNLEFFYEDRHMVSLSVLRTRNQCADKSTLSYYTDPYNTPSRLVSSIVRCLAKDKERLDQILSFSEPEPLIQVLKNLN
jgi:hypothetical protein